jgi:hypothetical protein
MKYIDVFLVKEKGRRSLRVITVVIEDVLNDVNVNNSIYLIVTGKFVNYETDKIDDKRTVFAWRHEFVESFYVRNE